MQLKLHVLYEEDSEAEVLAALGQLTELGWWIFHMGIAEGRPPTKYFDPNTGDLISERGQVAQYWVLIKDTEEK